MTKQIVFLRIAEKLKVKSGIAIVTVVILTFILLVLGAAFLKLATTERISADKNVHLNKAFYLAETGVERGREWLNSTSILPTEQQVLFLEEPFGGGTYDVTIEPISATEYEISSTGRFGHPTVAKTLNVIMQAQSVFSYAVFGDEEVTMMSNSYTDSYNSQNGLYGGANVGSNGDIGTNAITTAPDYAINIRNNAWVNGDAFIGPEGDIYQAIDVADTGLITGEQGVLDSEFPLPEVVAPTGLPVCGELVLDGDFTITNSGEYSLIILTNNSILTLDGDITLYITGPLELNSNSQLVVTEGSDINIYLGDDFYQESNTAVNNVTKDPTKLSIYGLPTTDDIIWYSNSEFYGALYAPDADILINSNAQIYGSIIGNTVTLDSNATVHYDEALAEESDYIVGYRVVYWEEEPAVWE